VAKLEGRGKLWREEPTMWAETASFMYGLCHIWYLFGHKSTTIGPQTATEAKMF